MQAAMQAGKAYVDSPGGVATVTFDDSYKQGDKLSLAFDTAAEKDSELLARFKRR